MARICIFLCCMSMWASAVPDARPLEACQHDDCEDSNLLSLRMHSRGKDQDSQAPSQKVRVGLAFQGGGWLSPADFFGVVSGLMAAKKRPLEWLFQEVRSLSADSGGNWFIQGLSFGERMLKVVETMALKPAEAGNIYNVMISSPEMFGRKVSSTQSNYTFAAYPDCQSAQQFLMTMNERLHTVNNDTDGLASLLAGATATFVQDLVISQNLTGPAVQKLRKHFMILQMLLMQAWVADDGYFSWRNFVAFLYEQSYGISPTTTLGSEPNKWAKGKILTAGTSFLTTNTKSEPWFYKLGADLAARSTSSITSITAPANNFAGGYAAPGIFSITMGQEGSRAPLHFCSNYTCGDTLFTYKLNGKKGAMWTTPQKQQAKHTLGEFYAKNFYEVAGSIPVADAGAAASAMLGGMFSVVPALAGFASSCGFIVAPFVAEGEAGEVFAKGEKLWLQGQDTPDLATAMPEFAEGILHMLVDGGVNDETGTAQALVAGNDEIVVFLEWNLGEESACEPKGDAYFMTQFAANSNESATGQCVNETINNYVDKGWLSYPGYTLFSTPSNTEVYDHVYNLTNDVGDRVVGYPPEGKAKFLAYISTGTLPEAITVENKLWGIEAGRKVTVHFVTIATKDTITYGPGSTLFQYGTLVQEVVDTLTAPENEALVEGISQHLRSR